MLKQRVITAVILASVLMGALTWLPASWFAVLVMFVFAAGAWEWAALCGITNGKIRMLYVDAVLVCGGLLWWLGQDAMLAVLVLSALWWCFSFRLVLVYPSPQALLGSSGALLAAGMLVLSAGMVALPCLMLLPGNHRFYVLWFIALVAAADIGAYFSGRLFGRHKLAPLVSPNKTWEGFIGGMVATAIVAIAGSRSEYALALDQNPLELIVLAALVLGAFSVVGDLFESLLKRQCNMKDSGNLLPGHGGVMDRLDSIVAALPLYVLMLTHAVAT
jgi:phosphatidate cytidylyltransferase